MLETKALYYKKADMKIRVFDFVMMFSKNRTLK